jgi:linoleoyl-CoA desaturase
MNFAPKNPVVGWYVGGLNYQIEHHLFPKISHVHYPAIAPIVREVCDELGLTYRVQPSMWGALRCHVNKLRDLGRPEPGEASVSAPASLAR